MAAKRKKWGKIGAPHSAVRRAWLRKIGRKGGRAAARRPRSLSTRRLSYRGRAVRGMGLVNPFI